MMRSNRALATAMLLSSSVIVVLSTASPAHARTPADVELHGSYKATFIGNWSKINQQYNGQPTVVSTWRINTKCTTMEDCTGTVNSDQGWTAPITMTDGQTWYVRHDVPNWERCQDGTAFTGQQTTWFYAVEADTGYPEPTSPVFNGKDKTIGPSGACGQNKWLEVETPFRLDKLG
jgi:hypothetical protein